MDEFQTEDSLQPLRKTPPEAKPIDESAEDLAEKAKRLNMDISTYVLHNLSQTLSLQQQIQRQPHVVPLTQTSRIDKNILISIGDMKPGDDIFVFLHKFEYNITAYNVSHYDWILYLPSLLHGPYSEAYYNNVTADTTFHTMKTVLLTTGRYLTKFIPPQVQNKWLQNCSPVVQLMEVQI